MATLVIDIETIGREWDTFSAHSKESIAKRALMSTDFGGDELSVLEKVKSDLSLSPFTGVIVSLAMYDVERDLGAVYFVSDDSGVSFQSDSFGFKARTEKEILEDFWEGARAYDTFVTWNGRSFTVPFLYHRSVATKIRPTVEVGKQRYLTNQSFPHHVDLLEEMTFYGAARRPSLSLVCDAFGIPFKQKFTGEDIAELYRRKKFRDIATHNAQDVLTIKELYEIWKLYLAPSSFLNTV